MGALVLATRDPRAIAALFLGMAAVLVATSALTQRRRGAGLAVVAGGLAIVLRGVMAPAPLDLVGAPDGSGPWTMVVESVGPPRDGDQVATLRTVDGGPTGFRLAASLPRYPPIEPGDRIEVTGRVRERPSTAYGQYLARIGAWGTLDARTLQRHQRPTDPGTVLESLRRDAGELLTRVLPEPEAGLAAGILIGLRDRVDRTVASAFTTAGVSHVVAISGWNIAIVAAAIGAMAGALGRRRRSIITAVAVVAYIAFAGASPSVLRAGAMAGVVLLARESGRAGRAAAALGWAASLLLLVEPALIIDAGFQLSTLATAGLIAWASPLTDRIERWTGGRLPRWIGESLGVSLAAQAATTPIVLASFGRLSLIAPAVNLLVVPLIPPAMAAGLIAMLGGGLVAAGGPTAIGTILATPAWVALRLVIGIVDVAAGLPAASVAVDPVAGVGLGLASATMGLGLIAWRRRVPRRSRRPAPSADVGRPVARSAGGSTLTRLTAGLLVVAVAVAGAVAVTRGGGIARLTVLDVGQGDAILIEGSRGGRLLVDGGPDPDRLLVELDRRLPPWDRRLDAVILSHPHEDHVAGLGVLLDRYRVDRVLEPGMRGPGPGYTAWLERVRRPRAVPHLSIAAGDRLAVDEIDLRVLWPIRGQVPIDPPDSGTGINNVSVVLLGTIGEQRFLLAGDVEEDIDASLLAAGVPPVDVLKVAHHGSRTATTDAFVARVRPRVAVASAGAGNPYGHPSRATLDRLASAGARVYRTDRDGSVSVAFDADGLSVRTAPRRAAAPVIRVVAPGSRAFLCAVPITPFVGPASMEEPRHRVGGGGSSGLGYHRAGDEPRPGAVRCPGLPPPSTALVRRASWRARGRPGR